MSKYCYSKNPQTNISRLNNCNCFDDLEHIYNGNITTNNEKLRNKNKKTRKLKNIKYVPNMYDSNHWKDNNLIVNNSQTNVQYEQNNFLSGYVDNKDLITIENFDNKNRQLRDKRLDNVYKYYVPTSYNNIINKIDQKILKINPEDIKYYKQVKNDDTEIDNFKIPTMKKISKQKIKKLNDDNVDNINLASGYDINNNNYNLPSNINTSICRKNNVFKQNNHNLFTQHINNELVTKVNILEPINDNIGISWTQQIPNGFKNIKNGKLLIEYKDPTKIKKIKKKDYNDNIPKEDNIIDSRSNGYSNSDRSYTNKLLGNCQFMYNDLDTIRQPNYIVRSKIDHKPFADQYGPLSEMNVNGNKNTNNIRDLVHKSRIDDVEQFRNSLQISLMRKYNANAWQQKMYPIYTNQFSNSGSGGGNGRSGISNNISTNRSWKFAGTVTAH